MQIDKNVSLKTRNTFGFNVSAEYFVSARSNDDIKESLEWARKKSLPVFVLGGGSNVVLCEDIAGLTLSVETRNITPEQEEADSIQINVAAGENWHALVNYCIDHHFHGIENLSLIPGAVGAAPIQNIGAYGVELCEHFDSLTAIDISTGETVVLSRSDCQFGYRDSVFKRALKNTLVIAEVTLNLSRTFHARTEYGNIQQQLENIGCENPTARELSDVICNIRRSKIPDPSEIGNAGSFFTNPIVPSEKFQALQKEYPGVVGFELSSGLHKVAAGWLVEQCNWKGYREENVGVHAQQSLVLINHSNGSGQEIIALAEKIQQSVLEEFGIALTIEPTVYKRPGADTLARCK